MKRSTFNRSSHTQGSNMRDTRARSPRTRSIRARSPRGRSTSRGRSPLHQSSIRSRSPNRRRPVGRSVQLSSRLKNVRSGGGNTLRGRSRASMIARRRNKRTKWRQNKKNRRRGRALAARNGQGRQTNAARMRMDDYLPPRVSRRHGSQKDIDIDRTVARARREASARTKDIFWTKKLLDAEQVNPNSNVTSRRWIHSGFKEMYKEELGYSEAEQSGSDRHRSDGKTRREVSSHDRRRSPLHSKQKSSRSPVRKIRRKSPHQKSKSPPLKESRSPQKVGVPHMRRKSLSRSPSSNSSISSSSFSNSYSSYSRSISDSSISGTSSVSSISYQRKKKRSHSPSPKRVSRGSVSLHQDPKVQPSRRPQQKVALKGVTLRPEEPSTTDSHYRSPIMRTMEETNNALATKRYDRDELCKRTSDDKHFGQNIVYSKPINSNGEDTDSESTDDDGGPRKMTLSERFGKLAQLSSQRQEYEGIRMKIVREGGQHKKVYLEGRTVKSRSPSPRKSRSKGAHERWLREHKAEYDDYEKRYGEFRQWDPHRDLPRELPPNWDAVNVRYRYYKESGYFGDRNISMEDYLKWEEWWYRYRDWLEKYENDSRGPPLTYEAATRISSSLWSRKENSDRKRRRY